MSRKSPSRFAREVEQIHWFQWEFLRRNTDYAQDYEAFTGKFGSWFREHGFWYDRPRKWKLEDSQFFYKAIAPYIAEICRKWNISDPIPPDWTFNELPPYRCSSGSRIYIPTGYAPERAAAIWTPTSRREKGRSENRKTRFLARRLVLGQRPGKQEKQRSGQTTPADPRFVHLKLDVTRPMRELIERARKLIDFHRRFHEEALRKLKGANPEARRRPDLYAAYIKVWDLRQQGLTFAEIARRVYPYQYEAQQKISPRANSVVQRVRDHHERAKELIDGGYKDLG